MSILLSRPLSWGQTSQDLVGCRDETTGGGVGEERWLWRSNTVNRLRYRQQGDAFGQPRCELAPCHRQRCGSVTPPRFMGTNTRKCLREAGGRWGSPGEASPRSRGWDSAPLVLLHVVGLVCLGQELFSGSRESSDP